MFHTQNSKKIILNDKQIFNENYYKKFIRFFLNFVRHSIKI